jgi:GNAT superfamily N-acetyltransferase
MEIFFGGTSFIYPGREGQSFCFKVAEPSDKEKIRTGFSRLSERSVYTRFFEHLKALSDEHLDALVNADQSDHVVWGAFEVNDPVQNGIGLGRFKRDEKDNKIAELGITVIDDYQNHGVGTILLAILYYLASRSDLQYFSGVILSDNWRLLNRFIKLGAQSTRHGTEHQILVPIYRDWDDIPSNSYSDLIRKIMTHLKENKLCT